MHMSYCFGILLVIFFFLSWDVLLGVWNSQLYYWGYIYSLRPARSCKNSTKSSYLPFPSASPNNNIFQNLSILPNQEIDIGRILLIQIQTIIKFHQDFFFAFTLLEGGCRSKKFYHIYQFVSPHHSRGPEQPFHLHKETPSCFLTPILTPGNH